MLGPQESGDSYTAPPQISLQFDATEALGVMAARPQSEVLRAVTFSVHDSVERGGYVGALVGEILERHTTTGPRSGETWEDKVLDRLTVYDDAQNVEEEEFVRVWQLRRGLTVLAWEIFASSIIPTEIKQTLSTRSSEGHLTAEEIRRAEKVIGDWSSTHNEEDSPLQPTPALEEKVSVVCERANDLVQFYANKMPGFAKDNNSPTGFIGIYRHYALWTLIGLLKFDYEAQLDLLDAEIAQG